MQKELTKSIFAVFKSNYDFKLKNLKNYYQKHFSFLASQQLLEQKLEYEFPKNIVSRSSRVSVKITGINS